MTKWKNFHSNHCMWLKHSFKFCTNVVPWQRANQLWHLNFTAHPLLAFKYCSGIFRVVTSILSFRLCKGSFLWVFTKLWKATISFVMSVCPSIWNNLAPTGRIFVEIWYLSIFQRSVKEIQVSLKSAKNKVYLMETNVHFFIISPSFLLRMRNVSGKIVEKIKTHFMFSTFFSNIVPFMRSRPPPGFDPRIIQPLASCYTNYATRPTQILWSHA